MEISISQMSSTKPYIRKRAVLISYKIFLNYPEALRPAFPRLREKLEDPDPGELIEMKYYIFSAQNLVVYRMFKPLLMNSNLFPIKNQPNEKKSFYVVFSTLIIKQLIMLFK